jgi:catechol 2,3-dioxygenase-like lactoylglutathione lyase family enzyme
VPRIDNLRRVLHHLTLWVPDLERAEESWNWLLGELGYVRDVSVDRVVLLRHPSGIAVVLEESPDMVPGMLYSRMRPGLNHLAFRVESVGMLLTITERAPDYGWSALPGDRHLIAGGAQVTYLEDRDGFEVELVASANPGPEAG